MEKFGMGEIVIGILVIIFVPVFILALRILWNLGSWLKKK